MKTLTEAIEAAKFMAKQDRVDIAVIYYRALDRFEAQPAYAVVLIDNGGLSVKMAVVLANDGQVVFNKQENIDLALRSELVEAAS